MITLTDKCHAVIEVMREHGYTTHDFIYDDMKYTLTLGKEGEAVYLNQSGAVIDKFSLRGVSLGEKIELEPCWCGSKMVHTHE